jgi:N-methylhydantoinase A/oxoprolinase/acetone carboxylase beta subunit
VPEGLSIGVDVGGTNTDAVLVDAAGAVLARTKTPTTRDPSDGIAAAIDAVAPTTGVARIALGTTHATNAIVQRRGLRRVAVLRLGAPGTTAIPPRTGWPPDLVEAIGAPTLIARGGVEVDGRRAPLDPDEIRRFGASLADADAIAVTGMFSPLDDEQEREAEALLAGITSVPLTRGHEIGGLGLLERENAAIVNAALGDVIGGVIDGLLAAAERLGAAPFLTQNDGTVMRPELARRLPVLTIGSGPSNSLRGAAALTGRTDCLVADVGGTTTDVGALRQGFPRESAIGVTVGGVRTNFRMPDLVSVAVGGGTIVEGGRLSARSVGADLVRRSLVFGGETPTLTDAAVAAGRTTIGTDPRRAGRDDLAPALAEADTRVADAMRRMRTSAEPVDVVVVGGGAVLLAAALPGARETIRPDHADVANAIGAALAPVAGEADLVADVGSDREAAVRTAVAAASERAIDAGADPSALETVWIDEIPLAYLDRPLSRLRAKVAGPAA